jgi:hypothetical protein
LTQKITSYEDIITMQEKLFNMQEECSQKNISSLEVKLQNMTDKYKRDMKSSRKEKELLQ